MNIDNSTLSAQYTNLVTSTSKTDDKEKIDAKTITNSYLAQYQFKIEQNSKDTIFNQVETFTLSDIGYEGKAIGDLSQDEATALVSEDGFFGVSQTSERIANFVLNGAGDNVDMLRAGREGILKGFKEAEVLWGGELPEISYETINKAVEAIDTRLANLGESILDSNV